MEIKRRLTKIAKSLSPQIEVMNAGIEMHRMCDRFEELVRYCQEKLDRAENRGETIGAKVEREKQERQDKIAAEQKRAKDEQLDDQEASLRERNKRLEKSQKPKVVEEEPEPMPDMSKKPTHPKKKAKELAKKKK